MSEKELVNSLKKYAEANGSLLREEDFENGPYAENVMFVIEWSGNSVSSLLVNQTQAAAPVTILRQLRQVERIVVYPASRDMLWLGQMEALQKLVVFDWTGRQPFPDEWLCTSTLKVLYLKTCFGQVPETLRGLQNLEEIGFDTKDGNILDLPEWLGEFPKLRRLLLKKCRIRAIPKSLVTQTSLPFYMSGERNRGIFLGEATLEEGDITLFYQPREIIEANYEGKMAVVRECKVIFLGDGGAGKTTLIDNIVHSKFDASPHLTNGIQITPWQCDIGGDEYLIRFMDFGGQEIFHSMHRCFLTAHTVYVVVCEGRSDTDIDEIAATWLNTVRTFAPDSPVLLVLNKMDLNPNLSVDERAMREQNPALVRVLKTSAAVDPDEPYGVGHLKQAIQECIPQCIKDYYGNENMLGVKRELEQMDAVYISSQKYVEICERHQVENPKLQQYMLGWFRDLGIAYSYGADNESGWESDEMRDIRVLNPKWLTDGIYRLIKHTTENGLLSVADIQAALNRPFPEEDKESVYQYNEQETEYILHIMRRFQISHKMRDGYELIPMKMPKTATEDAFTFDRANALRLRWVGSYIPDNLIHRLMISKVSELDTERMWRNGGQFKLGNCYALAEITVKNCLDVYVLALPSDAPNTSPVAAPPDGRAYMEEFRQAIAWIARELNLRLTEVVYVTYGGKTGSVDFQYAMKQYTAQPDRTICVQGIPGVIPGDILRKSYLDRVIDEYIDREAGHTPSGVEATKSASFQQILSTKVNLAWLLVTFIIFFLGIIALLSFLLVTGLLDIQRLSLLLESTFGSPPPYP